ncbi:MAG: hypothetical protein OEZ15_10585 [Gammaproteobacteria bacterium]|nr:hypothetical protein [Gammaproteobacteria bacterium]
MVTKVDIIDANSSNNNDLDCYSLNDQPMTCGLCGSRTHFDEKDDGTQAHQCLNTECGYKFIAIEDID